MDATTGTWLLLLLCCVCAPLLFVPIRYLTDLFSGMISNTLHESTLCLDNLFVGLEDFLDVPSHSCCCRTSLFTLELRVQQSMDRRINLFGSCQRELPRVVLSQLGRHCNMVLQRHIQITKKSMVPQHEFRTVPHPTMSVSGDAGIQTIFRE